ncbi:MAG: transposase [Paracoccaceae bacterium]
MAKMTEHTIGVDMSKTHLDVFDAERNAAKRFENSASGFRAFEKWLGGAAIARVVHEPTGLYPGPYHRNFEERFCDKLPLVKVNPRQARRFAEACGTRAKTDALDARGLAAWLAWCLTPAIKASGRASPLSMEDANPCVTRSRCQRVLRCATTRT